MVTQPQQAIRIEKDAAEHVRESLVMEEPLQININGRPFSITMRTPGADEELVRGLLFSEGVVHLEGLESEIKREARDGYTLAELAVPEIFLCKDLLEKRSLIANASCGFCGKREITDIDLRREPVRPGAALEASLIPGLGKEMRARQGAFEATGGSHAAAVFTLAGEFLALHEDVGRHNAVDKVIGFLVRENLLEKAAILFVSGRLSFEIVSKAAAAGIPFLCAVSAPSSLAVEMAARSGITLVAFCRGDRFTVYSNSQHINFHETIHG